ncbi:MAG: GFA family protein [Polymorphobacter sp.]|jgi:hypothetical protein
MTKTAPHAVASDLAVSAEGGCHCGAVRFAVRFAASPQLLDCNCSICAKTAFLHLITHAADFELLRGAASLAAYRFGTGTARHLFCTTCGIKSFYIPRSHPDGYSVNWRALEGVDSITPVIIPYDGRGGWESARAALDDA